MQASLTGLLESPAVAEDNVLNVAFWCKVAAIHHLVVLPKHTKCFPALLKNVTQAPPPFFFSLHLTQRVLHVGAKACVTDCKLFQHLKARIVASNTVITGWILITSLFG